MSTVLGEKSHKWVKTLGPEGEEVRTSSDGTNQAVAV